MPNALLLLVDIPAFQNNQKMKYKSITQLWESSFTNLSINPSHNSKKKFNCSLYLYQNSSKFYALKQLRNLDYLNDTGLSIINQELKILSRLKHDCILEFYGSEIANESEDNEFKKGIGSCVWIPNFEIISLQAKLAYKTPLPIPVFRYS